MKLLIAEDNQLERESLTALALSYGHETVACPNGIEALEALDFFAPDLIILDLEMPRMGGHELARQLQSRHPNSKWMLVAYTGRPSSERHATALASGFTLCYHKPDDLPAIIAILEQSI
ncbi:response regulator [Cupriavidus necator]|uniref:response regulator n=1 Tax=Cupriavidus necator TaxID=106590 RepID=UPI0039C4BF06